MPASRVDRLTVVEGEEHLRAALEMDRGVLLISGHFGNWEIAGYALGLLGFKTRLGFTPRPVHEVTGGATLPGSGHFL